MPIDLTKKVTDAINELIKSRSKESKATKNVEKQVEGLNKDYSKQEQLLILLATGQNKMINSLQRISKASNSVTNSTRRMNRQNVLWTKHTRILGGSLAVLRSKLLIISFGIAMVERSIGSLVKAYGDFEESQKRIERAIVSTGGAVGLTKEEIFAMSAALEETTGIAETTINTATGLLLTFTNIGEEVFPQAQKAVLDMAAAMYQSNVNSENLRSTSIQLGKALNDPIKGLTSLSRVGVAFTKQQKTLIKFFVNTNQKGKAQAIIIAELNKEFGDQASLEGYNKKMRELDTALGKVAERIGAELRPAVEQIVVKMTDLANAFDESKIVPFAQIMAASVLSIRLLAKGLGLALVAQVRHIKSISRVVKVGKLAIFNFLGLTSAVRKASIAVRGLTVATKVMTGPLGWILLAAEGLFLLNSAFKDNEKETSNTAMTIEQAEARFSKFDERQQIVTANLGKTSSAFNIYKAALTALGAEAGKAGDTTAIMKERWDALGVSITAQVEALRNAKKELEELAKKNKDGGDSEAKYSAQVQSTLDKYKLQSEILGMNNLVKKELFKVSADLFGIDQKTGKLMLDLNDALKDQKHEFYEVALAIETVVKKKQAMAQEMQVVNQRIAIMGGAIRLGSEIFKGQMDADLEAMKKSEEYKRAQKRGDDKKMEALEKKAMKKTLTMRKAMFLAEQVLAAANVVIQYKIAAAKGFGQVGPIFGIPLAAAMEANMIASLALIAAQTVQGMPKFAQGGDFITTGPQMMMVGDNPGGRERVSVTPLSSPNIAGPQGETSVVVNVSGNILTQDFVEGELAENIKEAIRRGTDFGIS